MSKNSPSNPTPEQQNEPGYTTKYTQGGKKWWTLDGIDWYPLTETYHGMTTSLEKEIEE